MDRLVMNDETPKKNPASPFRKMAESIERNEGQFGGAVVIVPPDQEEPVELLFITTKAELDSFWGAAKARLEIELTKLENRKLGQMQGWPSR